MTASHRLGLILVAVSTLAWSTAGLFTRAIHADLLTVVIWRGLFGALGLLAVLLVLQGWQGWQGWQGIASFARLGWAGWLYALISGVSMLCYITAPRETSIAHVAIIYAVVPFLTADLVWVMLRERPSRVALVASIAALTGSVVMVGFGHDGTLWGDGLALLMTFGMALLMIIARRHPDIPTMPAGIVSSVLCIALCLPLADLALPETDQLVILAGFGLVNSTLGFSLFLLGSTRIALIETALPGALEAPIAPLWVWLVFAETPTPATIAGGLIVLAAVFWHITRTYRSG